jgi:hypothetical protein
VIRFSILSAAVCVAFGTVPVFSQSGSTATSFQQETIAAMTVRDAPYSADAVTTVSQILGDGTKVRRSVTAKVYRDSAGRTRREETVIGLASLRPAADGFKTIAISDPVSGTAYNLYPQNRTALQVLLLTELMTARRQTTRGLPAPPAAGTRQGASDISGGRRSPASEGTGEQPSLRNESLGTKELNGLTATGRRTTQTIPVGAIGNDKAIVITTDTWESPKLRILLSSRHTDPRTGVVDYELVNLQLSEPRADLFVVPAGYTIVSPFPTSPGATGGRNQQPGSTPAPRGRGTSPSRQQ